MTSVNFRIDGNIARIIYDRDFVFQLSNLAFEDPTLAPMGGPHARAVEFALKEAYRQGQTDKAKELRQALGA